MSEHINKQITTQQRKALWLFMTRLADTLNDAGLDMKVVLKPRISIPWTKNSVHDYLFIPIQKALYGTDSIMHLHKIEQVDKVHDVLMRELGEKHHIEDIPIPSDIEFHKSALKYHK